MASSKPNKITVVCTANICRSPLGEMLLAEALKKEKGSLHQLQVVSAGVAARDGAPASMLSVEVLAKEGIDLSGHQSQALTQELVDDSLLILGMTTDHVNIIEALFEVRENQVQLYRGFLGPNKHDQIPDPFGGDHLLYLKTLDSIKEATPSIIQHLQKIS